MRYNWNNPLINFLKKYWRLILFLILGGYLYTVLHELIHYFFINYFGYSSKFCWTCLPTRISYLTPLDQILKNHYFISAIAPYLLSLTVLFILFVLSLLIKKRIWLILSLIPALDTFYNIVAIPLAYLTNLGNDFLNLFRIGFYSETVVIMLAPIILFITIWMNLKGKG